MNIKASILASSLLIAAALPQASTAQTHYSANVAVGVKGGLNLSRVQFTPSVEQSFNPGFNGGVTFRYIEENHFGLIVELNYEQRGWKEDFEDRGEFRYSRTVDFLQLPFLAHIYFGRRGKFFINAGPSVSLRLRESTSSNFDYANVSSISGFPLRTTAQFTLPAKQKIDYGISAGLGGEFSINRRNSIYLEGRFYYGLGNLLQSGRNESLRGSNSMTISISAGYWFRVK